MDRREFNNPLSRPKLTTIIDLLELSESDTVLDVGCGRGAALGMVLDRFACRGVGVDPDGVALADAADRLARHAARIQLVESEVSKVPLEAESIAAALCMGATHAFGSGREALPATLAALHHFVKPGGSVLIGTGFWKAEPPSDYLAATGLERDELRSHFENVALAEACQFDLRYVTTSSQDEWDHFESLTWLAAEEAAKDDPSNATLAESAARRLGWYRAYLQWGRDVWGFGLYLLRRPLQANV